MTQAGATSWKGKGKRSMSIMDFINAQITIENSKLTKEEFKRIRNSGTEEELIAAVEKMEAAGGYDNLG